MSLKCLDLELNPIDWEYYAEGGKHIVIINHNKEHKLFQYIIKIIKQETPNQFDHDQINIENNNNFLKNNFYQFFGCYIFQSIEIELSKDFLKNIELKISPKRSKYRYEHEKTLHFSGNAKLEQNLFTFPSIHGFNNSNFISFEIKVKCGLTSHSPFVSPNHQIKYNLSMFQIMQLFKQSNMMLNHEDPSWGHFETSSNYNPRDLCSGIIDRVNNSIIQLFENPQNNLKIVFNSDHIYGWDKCDLSFLTSQLQNVSFNPIYNELFSIKILQELLTIISAQEKVMQQVEMMQALDVIDTEGMLLLYAKGRTLIGNFDEHLFSYLSEPMQSDLNFEQLTKSLLLLSDHRVYDKETLFSQLNLSSAIKRLLNIEIPLSQMLNDEMIMEINIKAESLLEEFTLNDILLLLKLWMISYIAKDLSVIITIQPRIQADYQLINDELNTLLTLSNSNTWELQLQKCPNLRGKLYPFAKSYTDEHVRNQFYYEYQISIIDIDLKSLEKMRRKGKKEENIFHKINMIFNKQELQNKNNDLSSA